MKKMSRWKYFSCLLLIAFTLHLYKADLSHFASMQSVYTSLSKIEKKFWSSANDSQCKTILERHAEKRDLLRTPVFIQKPVELEDMWLSNSTALRWIKNGFVEVEDKMVYDSFFADYIAEANQSPILNKLS